LKTLMLLLLTGLAVGAGGYGVYIWWEQQQKRGQEQIAYDKQRWEQASQTHTVASYQQYLNDCNVCNYREKAEQSITSLKQQEQEKVKEAEARRKRGEDDAAFASAQQANTTAAYENYLKRCPDCQHRQEAETALAALNEFAPGSEFRDKLKGGGEGPEMIVIPAGEFMMGSPKDEKDRNNDELLHQVILEQPFAIGKYEVTFAEYDRFAEATGREKPDDKGWGRGNRPVINVSWEDAVAYTKWLSVQTGKPYRLPTEAEWEYAARAGTGTAYWWGNDLGKNNANCRNCGSRWDGQTTAPVGSFKPNAWGLYDTAGNVWEWAQDWKAGYDTGAVKTPTGPAVSGLRVLRGGSWFNDGRHVRSADRNAFAPGVRSVFPRAFPPGERFDGFGFRLTQGQAGNR
jgi:formylglycine-generating enzyme required for sulfatase activity